MALTFRDGGFGDPGDREDMLARDARVMTTFFVGRGDDRTDSAGASAAATLTASPGAAPVSEAPLESST